MTRLSFLPRLLVTAAALALPVASSHAQPVPTATAVLDKYVAAIGGRAALDQLTSIKQAATLQIPAVGLEAAVEAYMAAPNKMASKAAIPGMGEMLQGTDGTVAWDVNPMQGPRLLADKELAQMRQTADFRGNLTKGVESFSTAENLGAAPFAGEQAWKLRLVHKETGVEMLMYFSVASGLALGYEMTQESPMGPIQASIKLSEYKVFGGIKFPTRTEMTVGPQQMITVVKDVTLNGVPDSAFAIPAAVQPLIKK